MTVARTIAQQILTADGIARLGKTPRMPPLTDLVELARAHLSLTESGAGETLAQAGAVYVSHSAAATYAREEDIGVEEARRELTELFLDARQVQGDASQWRVRSRSAEVDATARVERDGRLLVVTSVSVRSR